VESLKRNRIALYEFFVECEKGGPKEREKAQTYKMDGFDWEVVDELYEILQLFHDTILLLETENNATLSVVPLVVHMMIDALTETTPQPSTLTVVRKIMTDDLKARWFPLDDIYWKAALLDPRTKSLRHCPTPKKQEICAWLKSQMQTIELPQPAFAATHSRLNDRLYGTVRESVASAEFDNFIAVPQLTDIHANAFEWWSGQRNAFPRVAKIAQNLLTVTASSASIERAFSAAKVVIQTHSLPVLSAIVLPSYAATTSHPKWKPTTTNHIPLLLPVPFFLQKNNKCGAPSYLLSSFLFRLFLLVQSIFFNSVRKPLMSCSGSSEQSSNSLEHSNPSRCLQARRKQPENFQKTEI
jgi:hypothetical protein